MPALRQGKTLFRVPRPAAVLRALRAGLRLHRFRRRARRVHHPDRRLHRRRLRPDRRGQISAAILDACGAVASAGPRRHAVAVARDEIAADRAAIPSQGRAKAGWCTAIPPHDRALPVRAAPGLGIFTLAMVVLFIGLGVWQLQRGAEKHVLIAALTERLAAPPILCRRPQTGQHSRRPKMSSAA